MIAWSSVRDGLKLSHSSIFTNKTYFFFTSWLQTSGWTFFFFLVSFSLLQCFLAFSLWSIDRLLTISLHPTTLSTERWKGTFAIAQYQAEACQTPNFLVLTSNFTVNFLEHTWVSSKSIPNSVDSLSFPTLNNNTPNITVEECMKDDFFIKYFFLTFYFIKAVSCVRFFSYEWRWSRKNDDWRWI